MEHYQVTGNEYLSFPTLRQTDAAIEGMTFLYMAAKGMIELKGDAGTPFLQPVISIGGRTLALTDLHWERKNYWIPCFTATTGELKIWGTLLCPIGSRGFFYRLEVENISDARVSCGVSLHGCWAQTLHVVNESKPVNAKVDVVESNWNHSFVMEARSTFPLFALAPIPDETMTSKVNQCEGGSVWFQLERLCMLEAGQSQAVDYIFGLGYEEVAAATSAKELQRQGYANMLYETQTWLINRERTLQDDDLQTMCNTNMFFSFFFSSGRTLDTEELVLMTSRSPRYYVSCAYWDRDSLLWSFPAILMTDPEYAKEILRHVFTRQLRNVGVHSRYIDGTVLEPGFELDELCAPIIALENHLSTTGDTSFFAEPIIKNGIEHILSVLQSRKHPATALYETFLMPTDDMNVYPYLTYDNVLVWKILRDLGHRLQSDMLLEQAEQVKQAIAEHCVKKENGERFYCWSIDLNGNYDTYDEPPGSLLLLPYYGFCDRGDAVYRATVKKIRDPRYPFSFAGSPIAEIGCAHAPHPWVLSVANSLLSGNEQSAVANLRKMDMDNGIACESVYEDTGNCATGEAFATCAGFLAYALDHVFKC